MAATYCINETNVSTQNSMCLLWGLEIRSRWTEFKVLACWYFFEEEVNKHGFLGLGGSWDKRKRQCSHTTKRMRRVGFLLGIAELAKHWACSLCDFLKHDGICPSASYDMWVTKQMYLGQPDTQAKLRSGITLDPNNKMPEAALLF